MPRPCSDVVKPCVPSEICFIILISPVHVGQSWFKHKPNSCSIVTKNSEIHCWWIDIPSISPSVFPLVGCLSLRYPLMTHRIRGVPLVLNALEIIYLRRVLGKNLFIVDLRLKHGSRQSIGGGFYLRTSCLGHITCPRFVLLSGLAVRLYRLYHVFWSDSFPPRIPIEQSSEGIRKGSDPV